MTGIQRDNFQTTFPFGTDQRHPYQTHVAYVGTASRGLVD